ESMILTADQIQTAAQITVSALNDAGYTCCLVGSGACYQWTRKRVPNDVDILVLPDPTQTKSAKEIKDCLATAYPTRFVQLPPENKPDAGYFVLWCLLPDDKRRCNIDVFLPGTISLPSIPIDRVAYPDGLPALPLVGALLHKVVAWSAHGRRQQAEKRENDQGDIAGMLVALNERGFAVVAEEKGIYPEWFLDEAFAEVGRYVQAFPAVRKSFEVVEKRLRGED
ncbi:hypothetical protein C8F01DRAFT_1106830, partial [Mycena amicta]